MTESTQLHELIAVAAGRSGGAPALTYGDETVNYGQLAAAVQRCAAGIVGLGLSRGDRVGIYLEKRIETVVATFGAAAAGAVFVPVNPLLKPEQVGYVLRDCDVRVLVTSSARLSLLASVIESCPSVRSVVVIGDELPAGLARSTLRWNELLAAAPRSGHRGRSARGAR